MTVAEFQEFARGEHPTIAPLPQRYSTTTTTTVP
jgi:hypothetical protein